VLRLQSSNTWHKQGREANSHPIQEDSRHRDVRCLLLGRLGAFSGYIGFVGLAASLLLGPIAFSQGFTLTYQCGSGTANVAWSCPPKISGGTPPYTFTLTNTDPQMQWMTIDPKTGILSGTPPFSFTVNPNAPLNLNLLVAEIKKGDHRAKKKPA
jgi:hypothetical protein